MFVKKIYTTQLERFPVNKTSWNQRRIMHARYLVPRNELSNVMFMIRLKNNNKFHVELEVPTMRSQMLLLHMSEVHTQTKMQRDPGLEVHFPFFFLLFFFGTHAGALDSSIILYCTRYLRPVLQGDSNDSWMKVNLSLHLKIM